DKATPPRIRSVCRRQHDRGGCRVVEAPMDIGRTRAGLCLRVTGPLSSRDINRPMSQSFLRSLMSAAVLADVERALERAERVGLVVSWVPLGGRSNYRGTVDVTADPGRAVIERITKAIGSVLESEFVRHSGQPDCRSPHEAAEAWLGVPRHGPSGLTPG